MEKAVNMKGADTDICLKTALITVNKKDIHKTNVQNFKIFRQKIHVNIKTQGLVIKVKDIFSKKLSIISKTVKILEPESQDLVLNFQKFHLSKFLNKREFHDTFESKIDNYKLFHEHEMIQYEKWHVLKFQKIPIHNFQFQTLTPNEENLKFLQKFYQKFDKFTKFSKNFKLFTLRDSTVIQNLTNFSKSHFHLLPQISKGALWGLAIGFKDKINWSKIHLIKNKKQISKNIQSYIQQELKHERIVEVKDWPRAVSMSVFAIKEVKSTGSESYVKTRYVNNCTESNLLLEEPAKGLKYSYPTAEFVLRNFEFYNKLITSSRISIGDRKDYVRLWQTRPSTWDLSLIIWNKRRFIDFSGRMGTTYASLYSQSLSFLSDWWYNKTCGDGSYSITLMDDSIIFCAKPSSFAKMELINKKMGFWLNEKKSKNFQKEIKWSGYVFDLEKGTLRLPKEKLGKLKKQIKELLTEPHSTLRQYASVLFRFYAARLVLCGLYVNLSAILFSTRQYCRLYRWFYDELELQRDIYDTKIIRNVDLEFELEMAVQIIAQSTRFSDIRRNITWLDAKVGVNRFKIESDATVCFTDASGYQCGFYIIMANQKEWMFAAKIPEYDKEQSINYKELMTICLCVVYLDSLVKQGHQLNKIIIFVDNTTAQSVALTRRVTLNNQNLNKLALFLSVFHMVGKISVNYQRISTENNLIADKLSRDPSLPTDTALKLYNMGYKMMF